MRLPRRLTADGVAALLLLGAAAVLVTTPYDGGSCTNILSAYALPAATAAEADPPAAPAALADARRAVRDAEAAVAALQEERVAVDAAQKAAQQARAAAAEAESDLWENSFSTDYYSVDGAELDVDLAESMLESAEDWLAYVQEEAADTSGWSFYDQQDVAQAQDDVDDARADVAEAEAALAEAEGEVAASESAATSAEQREEELDAAADAAEVAAADAASRFADRESQAFDSELAARSRVADLEGRHDVSVAEWSHERRVALDEVAAQNNVRSSCQENGGWRAGVAALDVMLLAALALRRWAPRVPRLPRLRLRLPGMRR
jgi:hypothetical protein